MQFINFILGVFNFEGELLNLGYGIGEIAVGIQDTG